MKLFYLKSFWSHLQAMSTLSSSSGEHHSEEGTSILRRFNRRGLHLLAAKIDHVPALKLVCLWKEELE